MRACGWAALGVAGWLTLGCAAAATFVLDDGSRIVGTIVHATRNTVTIHPATGGLRQVPVRQLERVEVSAADGQMLRGRYRSWSNGRSAVEVGDELLWLENDQVVAREPVTTRALAAVPPDRVGEAPTAAPASIPAASPRVPTAPAATAAPDEPAVAAAAPRRPSTAVIAPLPPPPAARSQATAAVDPRPPASVGPAPAAGPAMAATVPARDLPVVTVRARPADIDEKSGTVAFTVELSRPADDLLVVIYSSVDGKARAGADYEPLAGILTLPAGATRSEISTKVIDDGEPEGDEEFQLFLASNPELATIAQQWTKITIHDDD